MKLVTYTMCLGFRVVLGAYSGHGEFEKVIVLKLGAPVHEGTHGVVVFPVRCNVGAEVRI